MPRILVVDGEIPLAQRCRSELEQDGHDVHTIPDADAALGWLEANDADLVVLDLEVPGLKGRDLMTEILSHCRHTRIIVHTARACYRDFGSWGADAFVMKTGDLAPLRATISRLLRRAA